MILGILRTIGRKNKNDNKGFITFKHPNSRIAEEVRSIRTNLKVKSLSSNYRTLLVTSPDSGDGKSTTVANLAISLAQQGENVLLIDSNLRNPVQDKIFKLDNAIGLSTVLTGKSVMEATINRTEIGKLQVLTSGPKPENSAELLGSNNMSKLINKATELYDVVLIDSTSVLEVADASILANKVDGVILVCRFGKTEYNTIQESKKVLEQVKANVIGAILNERR